MFNGIHNYVFKTIVVPLTGISLCSGCAALSAAEPISGRGSMHTTAHFVIRSHGGAPELHRLGNRCEALLSDLKSKWFEQEATEAEWTPRCELFVHADIASYLRNVPGGARTIGSSWVETEKGRVVTRRIDIRGDRTNWFDEAMPHELMHMLLADRFIDEPMPRWAEEGAALLADPQNKQQLHDLDLRRATEVRRQFRLVELFAAIEYPEPARQPIFYGQSASVVRYLTTRRRPADFILFVERAGKEGYDAALRTTYGINGVSALESNWLRSIRNAELAVLK